MIFNAEFTNEVKGKIIGFRNGYPIGVPDFFAMTDYQLDQFMLEGDIKTPDIHHIVTENSRQIRRIHLERGIKKIQRIYNAFENKTIAICGAGESINEHIDELHDREDLTVLAINRANQVIDPDISFIMDRLANPAWYPNYKDSICITGCFSNWKAIDLDWKDIYLFRDRMMIDTYWHEKKFDFLYTLYFTTIPALHFAYKAGFKNVELFGHDFSFKENEYCNQDNARLYEYAKVQGVDGELWNVSEQWYWHAIVLRTVCEMARQAGMNIISRSKGIFFWNNEGK